jgi:lipid II:glycine glycyltransferase (peptidoglycan interpeptide bridge formation enzyme)
MGILYTVSMEIRFATDNEIDNWNELVLKNPDGGNVFQGREFADHKELSGWQTRHVVAGKIVMTVHEKPVPGLGKLWYIPKGPGVKSPVQLGDILPDLKTFANDNGVFAVKVESELEKNDDTLKLFKELELVRVTPIQPNFSTVLVDLSPDLDTIMVNLNQKGRHAIRRAERDGVKVKQVKANKENCKQFFDLLASTAHDRFFIRHYDYYAKFWQRYEKAGLGQMFFAYVDGQIVSATYAIVFGSKSTYKDGASVREKTVYGASHLLQWEVMKWAKEQGSKVHDLCGAPPSDRVNDETHPHYGIGRFKTSFNKQVTDYIGAYDLIVRPAQYKLWAKIGERATLSLWWRTRHESWY